MQRAAEALSRTGFPQRPDTQETVRRMAAMKMESVLFLCLFSPCLTRVSLSKLFCFLGFFALCVQTPPPSENHQAVTRSRSRPQRVQGPLARPLFGSHGR